MTDASRRERSGFTLIELSIVLVIIGLVAGGILVGRELIRAAELRAVTREVNGFQSSINAFRLKYKFLPGDIPNASLYWPGETYMGQGSYPVAGNGNGNGRISDFALLESIEAAWAWKHLSLSEILPGGYSGNFNGRSGMVIGTDVPEGKIRGVGYLITYDNSKNTIRSARLSNPDNQLKGPYLLAQEAASIDEKVDDGLADRGKVLGLNSTDGAGNPVLGCRVNPGTDESYDVDNDVVACRMTFIID